MTNVRGRAALLAVGLSGVLLVGACGSGSGSGNSKPKAAPPGVSAVNVNAQPREKVKDGGRLTLSIQQWIAQYNSYQVDGTQGDGAWITSLVEPNLWRADAKGVGHVNPDVLISAKVTASAPHQVVTYEINPKAIWSDNTPVTYKDFLALWTALNGKNSAYLAASNSGYNQITGVARGKDDREVKVTFGTSYGDWHSLFDPLVPAKAISTPTEFNKGWLQKAPITGGPWKFGTLDKTDQTITLVPDPHYWGDKPKLSQLILRALDADAYTESYLNKEIDLAPARLPDAYKRLSKAKDTDIRSGSRWDESMVLLSNKGALSDLKVRQAVEMAINRDAVAKVNSQGLPFQLKAIGNHFLMPNQAGYKDNSGIYGKFNPDQAKKLLDQAGWKDNGQGKARTKSGKQLNLQWVISSGSPTDTAELVKSMLSQVGINVVIQTVPANDFFEKYVNVGKFDLAPVRSVDAIYPSTLISGFMQPSATNQNGNPGGIGSAAIDALLTQASQATDPAQALDLYNKADAAIWEIGNSIPLYQTPQIDAVRHGLANYGASGLQSESQEVNTGWQK